MQPPLTTLKLRPLWNALPPLRRVFYVGALLFAIFAPVFSILHNRSGNHPVIQLTPRSPDMKTAFATFGAGCFWGVEQKFREMPGVVETAVGYMGGQLPQPTYDDVCTDTTGHAEVVQIEYDPEQVTYEQLLAAFWQLHDPTQVNRQGPDFGKQYRSVVFTHSPDQATSAEASKQRLSDSGQFSKPIATQIVPLPVSDFWRAEDYHQQYLEKRGLGSCHL